MRLKKPDWLSHEQIAEATGKISSRTVKRYFADENVTTSTAEAIKQAIIVLSSKPKKAKGMKNEALIELSSLKIRENVFWSNPGGKLPLKNIVAAVAAGKNLSDFLHLKKKYGHKKVIEAYRGLSVDKRNHLLDRLMANVS